MRKLVTVALAAGIATASHARTWAPRTDGEIVALDLATGAVKWTHKGSPLGNAHFELYPGLLVAYPHYDNHDKTLPMFLDPATGAVVKDTRDPKRLVKASSAQWIREPIVLANGWRLDNFRAGYVKELELVDPASKRVVWTVKPAHYPERVLAHKDLLLVAYGYLTNEAVLYAYRAGGAKPAWELDFNDVLKTPKDKRLGRVAPELIDNVLYAQTGPHVFAIEPATGKVLWHIDAAAATKLRYEPDLYGGALDVAVFSRDRDVLVVAFEKRVLALRAGTGALLWHVEPDTFPHSAFPLAKDGLVFLSSGPRRGAPAKP